MSNPFCETASTNVVEKAIQKAIKIDIPIVSDKGIVKNNDNKNAVKKNVVEPIIVFGPLNRMFFSEAYRLPTKAAKGSDMLNIIRGKK